MVFVNMENEIVLGRNSLEGGASGRSCFSGVERGRRKKHTLLMRRERSGLSGWNRELYQYQEMTAPEGYIRDPQIYTFTVGEDGRPEDLSYETGHVIFNMPTRTEILKVDGCTGEALEGAVLTLKDHSGKVIKNVDKCKKASGPGRTCSG